MKMNFRYPLVALSALLIASILSGYAMCYSTGGAVGHCTTTVGAGGTCTCAVP